MRFLYVSAILLSSPFHYNPILSVYQRYKQLIVSTHIHIIPRYPYRLKGKGQLRDIVITNRFLEKNLLENWPLFRIFLTRSRHLLISLFLSISYDASGALRCINCQKVALSDLILAKNGSYAYFWESIFILHKKKYRITEIPIHLPYRIVGSSKMTIKDVFISVSYLMIVFLKKILGKYNFK